MALDHVPLIADVLSYKLSFTRGYHGFSNHFLPRDEQEVQQAFDALASASQVEPRQKCGCYSYMVIEHYLIIEHKNMKMYADSR